jgi:FkbM family methyltransferase
MLRPLFRPRQWLSGAPHPVPGGFAGSLIGMPCALKGAGMVCTDSTKASFGALTPARETSTTGWLQRWLLASYKLACRTGVMSTRLGRAGFLVAYERYKAFSDAAHLELLGKLVRPGSTVIDVGANVGFYTRRFAEWVRPGGEVIAIEPEELNVGSLKRRIARHGLVNVKTVQAVASEERGTLRLSRNPYHPADHRIGEAGVEVAAVTIDDLVGERGWPAVSLIKIDVQGAEERVLRGAVRTLRELRPAVFIEVDDAALRSMGSSAEAVLDLLVAQRYEAYRVAEGRRVRATKGDILSLCERGAYVDLLCVPRE